MSEQSLFAQSSQVQQNANLFVVFISDEFKKYDFVRESTKSIIQAELVVTFHICGKSEKQTRQERSNNSEMQLQLLPCEAKQKK